MTEPEQQIRPHTSEQENGHEEEVAEPKTPGQHRPPFQLTEAELQIIEELIAEGGTYNATTVAARLRESGFERSEADLQTLLQKYRLEEVRSEPQAEGPQSEPVKQSRPTANQAKKFIVDCATTLNAKQEWSKKKKSAADEEPAKKRKSDEMRPQPKSKRKVRPQEPMEVVGSSNPEERFLALEGTYRDCQNQLTKKNSKKSQATTILQPKCYAWVEHEFFYSNYDLPYYDYSEFQEILQYAGLGIVRSHAEQQQKFSDYATFRMALGKPRLFSHEFIQQQRNVLETYRQLARNYVRNENINELIEGLPCRGAVERFRHMTALKVGQVVVALHPICGHLHIGSILALYKENQIMVKFQNPELGVQKVFDINISSEYNLRRTDALGRETFQFANQDIIENFDYQAAALALQALHYKNQLILELRNNNNQLEEMKTRGEPITEEFKQQYGWINCLINILNFCLKHVMTRFRLRGANSYNMDEVGKNLPKLLTNPLNFMEKELEDNVQTHDNEALRKIREIVQQQQENRINEATEELCRRNNPDSKELEYEPLVVSFVSLLVTLRLEGRISNVADNRHMQCLAQHLFPHHKEQLAEIGDLLLSLSSK